MRRLSLQGTDLSKCEFVSCQWDEKDGRNILHDETFLLETEAGHYGQTKRGRIKRFLLADLNPFDTWGIGRMETLYRHMKVKFKDMHDESQVSKWHASEKEMQRKKASIIRNPFDWFLLNIYRSFCGYGENPKRAFLVLILMLLFFSALLADLGIKATKEIPPRTIEIETLLEQFHPSMLSDMLFCTLQYAIFEKDPYFMPITRTGNYVTILIKIIIPIQTALLVFALRNRFRR